ncbi:hypothetical protein [Metabacillus sp. 84]
MKIRYHIILIVLAFIFMSIQSELDFFYLEAVKEDLYESYLNT